MCKFHNRLIKKHCNFQSLVEKAKDLEKAMEKLVLKDEELKSFEKRLNDSSNEKSMLQEQVEKLDDLEKLRVSITTLIFSFIIISF